MAEKKDTTENKSTKKELYKLSRDNTQFTNKGWTIHSGEEKELPKEITPAIRDRIDAGFIVKVE